MCLALSYSPASQYPSPRNGVNISPIIQHTARRAVHREDLGLDLKPPAWLSTPAPDPGKTRLRPHLVYRRGGLLDGQLPICARPPQVALSSIGPRDAQGCGRPNIVV